MHLQVPQRQKKKPASSSLFVLPWLPRLPVHTRPLLFPPPFYLHLLLLLLLLLCSTPANCLDTGTAESSSYSSSSDPNNKKWKKTKKEANHNAAANQGLPHSFSYPYTNSFPNSRMTDSYTL
jgi:hypothetical protein